MFTVEIENAVGQRTGGKRKYESEDEALRKVARVMQALEYDKLYGFSAVLVEDGKDRVKVTVE